MSAQAKASEPELDRAYHWCARIARRHYENFPVASLLLPAHMRPAVAAIYAFARRADDFADEPGPSESQRIRLLDDWHTRLLAEDPPAALRPSAAAPEGGWHLCWKGGWHRWRESCAITANGRAIDPDEWIFLALHDTMRRHRLPLALFEALLSAFRQDVSTRRYATWADVLDYCRRSADPVGRLVLRVAGHEDRTLDERSDALCTALQLTNFWQDFGVDWRRGRLYLPAEVRDRAGAIESDLDAGRLTTPWRQALEVAITRTRELFTRARPLCDSVPGRLRWQLRLTWLGGSRILDMVHAAPDVLHHRPHLSSVDLAILAGRAVVWR